MRTLFWSVVFVNVCSFGIIGYPAIAIIAAVWLRWRPYRRSEYAAALVNHARWLQTQKGIL